VPLLKSVTTVEGAETVTVFTGEPLVCTVTMYPVMVPPPSEVGGDQLTVATRRGRNESLGGVSEVRD
jgi:hypothetical protein